VIRAQVLQVRVARQAQQAHRGRRDPLVRLVRRVRHWLAHPDPQGARGRWACKARPETKAREGRQRFPRQ